MANTTTASKPLSKPAKATAKPASKPADVCRMTLTIRGENYTVRPLRPETMDVTQAWRLRKADGTTYVIADTDYGQTCDCGDYTFRHEGIDEIGCKHLRAARALGLINADGEDPADWPRWTDAVAFTTSTR